MNIWIMIGLLCMAIAGLVFIKSPIGKTLLTVVAAVALTFGVIISMFVVGMGSIYQDVHMVMIAVIGFAIFMAIVGALWNFIKKKLVFIPIAAVIVVCAAVMTGTFIYEDYVESIPTVGENSSVLYEYSPFMEGSKAVILDEESSLRITEDFPVMDGATALYPVYAAFARAVYPKEMFANPEEYMKYDNEYLCCSTTAHAYERIVTGEADIIFVAAPSEEQARIAKDVGVELVFTPVGKEAFVFFVNSKNPIENMSLEDVQRIYSGEITKWSELGVKSMGRIRAFQRDEGSGSQSALERLMAGRSLMEAPRENVIGGMGGIINKTADYRNFKNAIGYSFRFYSTEMVKNDMIKLLSINGVAPTLENIENGAYPIVSEFYAVTRSDATENTLKLLEWVQGDEGQKIVEMVGYAPLK